MVDDSNLYVLGGYNPKFLDVPNTDDTYYPLFKEVYMYTVIKLRSYLNSMNEMRIYSFSI